MSLASVNPFVRMPVGGVEGILFGNGLAPVSTQALTPQLGYLRVKPNVTPLTQVEFSLLWGSNPFDYNFQGIAPGGTLTAATPATVTLPYGPLGVNGTDQHHWITISGGTGGIEYVLITGGTCTSGLQASCTLQFTPANSHSGAWVINSSSTGLQEALNATDNVLLPANETVQVYAPVTPPYAANIMGCNPGSSIIQYNGTNTACLDIVNDRFTASGFALIEGVTPANGNFGIRTHGPGADANAGTSRWGNLRDLYVVGFYRGIFVEGNEQLFDASHIQVTNCISDGITLNGAQGYWDAITVEGGQGNGFTMGSTTAFGGSIIFGTNWQTFNNAGWGISTTTVLYLSGGNTYLNNDKLGELLVNSTQADVGYISDANVQFAGQSDSWGTINNSPGIQINSGSGTFAIINCHFFNCQGNSIVFGAANGTVENCVMLGSGQGGQAFSVYAVAASAANDCMFNGNRSDKAWLLNGNRIALTANKIITASDTVQAVLFSAGTDVICDDNTIVNPGAGGALGITAGVTYQHGNNIVVGAIVNNGAVSSNSHAL